MTRIGGAALRSTVIGALMLAMLAAAPVVSASAPRPVLTGAEVGYFGSSTVAHRISVFVYSSLRGSSTRVHVTVCVGGACKTARAHRGSTLTWYSVSFHSRPLQMGDAVRYTVIARDRAGALTKNMTSDLLCMHNNGSTPQA